MAAASADLTGKNCSPNGFHRLFDTYSQSQGPARSIVESGGRSWYFLAVDDTSGQLLKTTAARRKRYRPGRGEASAQRQRFFLVSPASPGKQRRRAALANSTGDMVNAIKQAREFQLRQQLATFFCSIENARALGLQTAKAMRFVDAFFWDAGEAQRAWLARYLPRAQRGCPPRRRPAPIVRFFTL
jgi:branched-chain amino acid transport system substrate-binding protein